MEPGAEARWQNAWAESGLSRAVRRPGREKFYAIVAYPGASGFLHIGHLRGLTMADALHRYQRMRGRSVFFPTGTHATGLPAVTFAQKVHERDRVVVAQLEDNGVPREEWARLEEPEYAARFLGRTYLKVFREIGLLIDESAYVTTIDEDYRAFIRWQFGRLDRAGALVQAPHYAAVCPVCGPVSVDPSETDLSRGGNAEWIVYTGVPFTLEDGRCLLAATLRPETLFGATNVWISPDGPLVVWHLGTERFIVSEIAGPRLVAQHGGHIGGAVRPGDLEGRIATVPITGERVPVLSSRLVEPGTGTGVVMSVPAHAPADWLAIQDLPEHLRRALPTVAEILTVDPSGLGASDLALLDGDGLPAEKAARAAGARGLSDRAEVADATQRLYRLELARGRMAPTVLDGVSVAFAREQVSEKLASDGKSPTIREFSEPVVCRNGHEVLIRQIPDQWFLRYGDPAWKARTAALIEGLTVSPTAYKEELPGILDWFADRPCTRRGRWLGTAFPKDESWVIEPIADSTLYPLYYPVRRYVADGRVPTASLTAAFFDFVLLGEGRGEPSLPQELQEEIRDDVAYWYPLDLNIGGKEHKRVHFPVFLATHALLLPPALHPRGLLVHWWITDRGGKISKKEVSSKGGAIPPLRDALRDWGADALRLLYLNAASPDQDIEWDPSVADRARQRLGEIDTLCRRALADEGGGPFELERWLETRAGELVEAVRDGFDRGDFRRSAEAVYAEFPNLLRRFFARGGRPGPKLRAVAEAWIRLMSPITPHLAEELGAGRSPDLVAAAPFPAPEEFSRSDDAVASEALIDRIEEDLRQVIRPAAEKGTPPDAAVFFVAAPWKSEIEPWIRDAFRPGGAGGGIGEIMKRVAAHPELSARKGEVAQYAAKFGPVIGREKPSPRPRDELDVLRSAQGYLMRRLELRAIAVYPEDEAPSHDPKGRRARAQPGRPAFFLTGGSANAPSPG